ncbi:MAG: Ig-like domain-containing protein [Gemmatimonadota bacterium]|nr:Ig-like domain-containing protein [Gemmatimonadota bacterium]
MPVILKVEPESGAINVKAKSVIVRFNEVVSERPRVGNSLADIVVLSPSDGAARVDWNRSSITVRPRKGFRPNTAYSLTIMPGLADLAGNPTTKARTFVFGTGATIPRGVVAGAVFDWTTLKPASDAHVEARLGGDTTFRWIARADTLGWYKLPFMPPGSYIVRSFIDANTNGKLEPRELWDSVTVGVTDSMRVDMYAFTHDTLGPRVVGADVKDSVTLRLTFDRPLVLNPQLTAQQVEVRRADSSLVRVLSVTRAALFDSLARVREAAAKDSAQRADTSAAGRTARARADTARMMAQRDSIERARIEARRASRDTVPKIPPPVPTRMAIASEYIAVLEEPLVPGSYRVTVKDAVNPSLAKRTSERTFTKAKSAEKKGDADKKVEGDAKAAQPAAKPAVVPPAPKPDPSAPAAKPAVVPPAAMPPVKPPAK